MALCNLYCRNIKYYAYRIYLTSTIVEDRRIFRPAYVANLEVDTLPILNLKGVLGIPTFIMLGNNYHYDFNLKKLSFYLLS